jgi:serine/threonine protein kinase
MMPTLEQFMASVVASGLLSEAELRDFLDGLPPGQRPNSAEDLARLLVHAGRLTAFQAKCLYQGKTRGLVLGEYVLLEKIGGGGMGVVFKARHRRMERIVALKTLHAQSMKEPESIQRFYREVKTAARLNHPNIVLAHDAGEHEGIHYFVMEYVEGRDLATVVRERGPLPVEEAVDYLIQAARGLAYAHAQGVIHRDIKPGNLLVDRQGTVKILDMGLARVLFGEGQTRTGEQLTGTGQVMGTCDYMAPEQAVSTHDVDHRADIYSLGCTLYRLLTGEPPYKGNTLVEVLLAHREAPIPSLRAVRPEVPEELEVIFQRMVAKRPEERYQRMEEVIGALESCRAKVRVSAGGEATRWVEPASAEEADQAETETLVRGREPQTPTQPLREPLREGLPGERRPLAEKVPVVGTQALLQNPYLQVAAVGIGLVLLVGLVLVLVPRGGSKEGGKEQPTVAKRTTPPRRAASPRPSRPEWETAWEEAARKASEFLAQQEYGRAMAEYQGVADRYQSLELAGRLQEVLGQIQEQARTAYSAVETEARSLLGEKRFAEARAVLQPVIERFGIPEYAEAAQQLLAEIERGERELAASTPATPPEAMPSSEVPTIPAESQAEKPPAAPETTAEEVAARAEVEKYRALRGEWEQALRPVEERLAAWDFAGALDTLKQLPLGEGTLAERLKTRQAEIEKMAQLKGQIIQAINMANPRLEKKVLLLRGMNGQVTGADEEGITAELSGGKSERHPWGQLTEKSLEKVVRLGIRPEVGEDWLAAGLVALAGRAPSLAEECFGQAEKLGVKVEEYVGSLVDGTLARADEELKQGDQLLRLGQEAQKEGKTAEAVRRLGEAESHYQAAAQFLASIKSSYSQSTHFAKLDFAIVAIENLAERGAKEAAAERLYTEAVELYQRQELHDVKRLVQELKVQYSETLVFGDASRKPSVAELDAATANLGPRLTVALTGKADFRSIQAAIDAAHGGELIEILDNGPYNEYILIPATKTGLTLRGKRGCWPVITSLVAKPEKDQAILSIQAPRTFVERLVLLKLDQIQGCCLRGAEPASYTANLVLLYAMPPNGLAFTWWPNRWNCKGEITNSVIMGPCSTAPVTFRNCLFCGPASFGIEYPTVFDSCTIATDVLLRFSGHIVENCLVRNLIIDPNSNELTVHHCVTFGEGRPPPEAKDSFFANPMFRDPANLDYRLMPGSPCIGKASDGGDLGCRYTPEMIELISVALELRRRGIIKF